MPTVFYKRQFLNREEINKNLMTRLKEVLNTYFDSGQQLESGTPSIEWMARQLGISKRYMSDSKKQKPERQQ